MMFNSNRKNQKILFYATYVSNRASFISAITNKKYRVILLTPWLPSRRFISILNLLSSNLARKIASRPQRQPKSEQLDQKFLSVFSLYSPLMRRVFNRQPNSYMSQIVDVWESKRAMPMTNDCDISIVTSDFLNAGYKPLAFKNFIEFRWHDININNIRIPRQLEYPDSSNNTIVNESWRKPLARFNNQIDGFIVYSEIAADSFKFSGIDRDRIFILPLLDPVLRYDNFIEISTRTKDLLYVGRGNFDKGLDIAVSIACSLSRKLTIIGNFDQSITKWLNTFTNVTNLGVQPRSLVHKEMRDHRILLSTGIESFGFAVVEALNNGMQVVGSKYVGSLEWYFSEPNVHVVEEYSLDGFIKKTEEVLAGPLSTQSIADYFPMFKLKWTKFFEEIMDDKPTSIS